jgi:hypothetical protein
MNPLEQISIGAIIGIGVSVALNFLLDLLERAVKR